jgi:predicted NBD/HSP70 family sugar kinase
LASLQIFNQSSINLQSSIYNLQFMGTLGVELLDSGAIAVAVDDDGTVTARADAPGTDLADAASSALLKLSASSPVQLGIASTNPDSFGCTAAVGALTKKFQAKTAVTSGVAAAVAEAWVGAARGSKEVVYFSIAEHAIAGILRDGLPMTGSKGRAGLAAWLALNPVEREDYRKVGCVEAEVSASGIVRRLIWRIKAGDESKVTLAVKGDLGAVSVEHVLEAARAGDGVSISVIRDTAKYLGMAAANLVVVADPEVLVLGGIMASAKDLLFEPVRTEIARRLPAVMMKALAVRTAQLAADAPAIGAARLAASAPQ